MEQPARDVKASPNDTRARRRWAAVVLAAAALVGVAAGRLWPLVLHSPQATGEGAEGVAHSVASLLPPVVAVVVVLVTRRVILALASGVLAGVGVSETSLAGAARAVWEHVFSHLVDGWHLYVMGFSLCVLGMVRITTASGGASALVEKAARWLGSARRTKIGTAGLGVAVFFDDYANAMLVGPTMRPLADRFGVSRAKLAYLVDSTAAPIAGLALISTWVGYEIGLLGDQLGQMTGPGPAGLPGGAYLLLIGALPFRFYCLFALVLVFMSSVVERDFAAMWRAESRARASVGSPRESALEPRQGRPGLPSATGRARFAVLPVGLLIVGVIFGLVLAGGGFAQLVEQPVQVWSLRFWQTTLSSGDSNVIVLFWSALGSAVVALVLPAVSAVLPVKHGLRAFANGAREGALPMTILLFAWAMGSVCKAVGTGPYLVSILSGNLPPLAIPLTAFAAAAGISFATGTSWGTMAILIPAALPVAYATQDLHVFVLTVAAVMDGAIFGDHCSPISDTTVISSISTGCDPLEHAWTQLPYALVAMFTAAIAGYVASGLGAPVWVCYAIGSACLWLALLYLGKPLPDTPGPNTPRPGVPESSTPEPSAAER